MYNFQNVEQVCGEDQVEVQCRTVNRDVVVNEKQQKCGTKTEAECRNVTRNVCKRVPEVVKSKVPDTKCEEVCSPR